MIANPVDLPKLKFFPVKRTSPEESMNLFEKESAATHFMARSKSLPLLSKLLLSS